MTVLELISKLQSIQKEIGGDEDRIGAHRLKSTVSFRIENPEIDMDLELVSIDASMLFGCGCWDGVTFVLRAKPYRSEAEIAEEPCSEGVNTKPSHLQTGAAGSVPDFTAANIAALDRMIADCDPNDLITRDSLDELREKFAASPSPPVRETVWGIPREPDRYSTDDEGGLLEDLLDECDHGAIIEVTPYWCGEKQWAVVHYDEDGFADHRLFDSADEAEKFRSSTPTDTPTNESEGVNNV